jgi:stage V sporulation protein AD
LGEIGRSILIDAFADDGINISERHRDCGCLIFNRETQDTHSGGSGCGCSASVLCGHILNGMLDGRWGRILFGATGALMSPLAIQQGESIPSICHLLEISTLR